MNIYMKSAVLPLLVIFLCSFAGGFAGKLDKLDKDDIVVNGSTIPDEPPVTEVNPPASDDTTPTPFTTPSPSPNTTITTTTSTTPTTTITTPTTTKTAKTTTKSTPTTITPPTTSTEPSTKATTTAPSPPPSNRKFDGPSFVGGIVLALGLVAIGFVAFKFYKARTELNYHTL